MNSGLHSPWARPNGSSSPTTRGAIARWCRWPRVHADQDAAEPKQDLSEFFHHQTDVLLPGMNARQAAGLFEASHSESLAVVSDRIERRVIGQLSEAHTLRRYSEELDKQRRDITGSGE